MITVRYSHRSGDQVVPSSVVAAVERALAACTVQIRTRSASTLRASVLGRLRTVDGWSQAVRIRATRGLTITAMNNSVGLCLQTGNMARFYADLLKLQAQYLDEKLTSAIYILPTRDAARRLGSNIAHYERFTAELQIFQRVITVPLVVIGFGEQAG